MEGGGRSTSIIYQLEFARRASWSSRVANRGAGSAERNFVFWSNLKSATLYALASVHCTVWCNVVGNGCWVGFDKHGGSAGYHSETRRAG